jgi:hypothetical protein
MRFQAICIAVFLALSGVAAAQTPEPSTCTKTPHMGEQSKSPQFMAAKRAERQACAADVAAFCANVPKGCGRPKQCLKAHAAQLSPACTSAWQNLRAMRKGHG